VLISYYNKIRLQGTLNPRCCIVWSFFDYIEHWAKAHLVKVLLNSVLFSVTPHQNYLGLVWFHTYIWVLGKVGRVWPLSCM